MASNKRSYDAENSWEENTVSTRHLTEEEVYKTAKLSAGMCGGDPEKFLTDADILGLDIEVVRKMRNHEKAGAEI